MILAQFRLIAPTLRYFGISDWRDDGRNFSIQTHADDLATFIKTLGMAPLPIVGWSFGGAVSLAMTAQHPQLVERLFLYEPSLQTIVANRAAAGRASYDSQQMTKRAKAAMNGGETNAAVQCLMDDVNDHSGDFQRLSKSVRSIMQQNGHTLPLLFAAPPPSISCEELGELDIPVSIAVGEQSREFYRLIAKAASQSIPDAKLIEVPGARHLWPIQDPAAFSRLVLDFLSPSA